MDECRTTEFGQEYVGHQDTTLSGYQCQRWDTQTPHPHFFVAADFFVDNLSEVADYCRDPVEDPLGPWCWTLEPGVRAETCGIPFCQDGMCI